MAKIIWAEPALQDLNEVAEYIALDKADAAKKLVQKVFKTVERLKRFPESGRRPPEFKRTQYREILVGPCRIFYRLQGTNILIMYVMRGERQLRNYILDEQSEKES